MKHVGTNGCESSFRRSLVLIEAGEAHEIACALGGPLRTINVYAPPAY